jgi:luciferase family oxidoreductase group 1
MSDPTPRPVHLSVLDHGPVTDSGPVGDALRHSTQLAQLAERSGYHRLWVAEHHGRRWMASSTPPVLMAHLAANTSTIRIGSGALLLSNYAPLAVAEQFGTLEALHPGRIDLGLGRAAGTDAVTAHALSPARPDFLEAFAELLAFFQGTFPAGHPYAEIVATPGRDTVPAVLLLGSGNTSAQLAGQLGLPFAHGGHFAAANTATGIAAYRAAFRPSAQLGAPYVLLSVGVIAAPTDQEADQLNAAAGRHMARALAGDNQPFPVDRPDRGPGRNPDSWPSDGHGRYVANTLATHVVGGPDTVRRGLTQLIDRTGADELLITTIMPGYAERLRSYELVANALHLETRKVA